MKKRMLSILLSVCLLVGLLPTIALAGGFEVTTYQELVDKLSELQSGYAYLVPAEDFGWPAEATLTIPANVGIQVETGKTWEIPSGITVNFAQNCQGIQCDELTINGTMNMAYSSQDMVLRKCKKIIIGSAGTFTCESGDYGFYIAPSQTCEVQSGATLNPHVRLDGKLTGEGTVSGRLEVSGGFSGTASNATLSGNLTLTGGLNIGRENSSYADRLTVPADSHIKINSWTTISHATVYLNGVMEWEKGENSANSIIAASGKIVMDGGKLIFNTPCKLRQTVFELANGEEETHEKVHAAIPEPLVDGTGVIRFNDQVSEAGQEHGQIMGCNADLVARTAQQVRAGTYDVENANAQSWEPYYAIDLVNIDIERSWVCEHTWNDGEVTTEPTCTQPGVKTYTCSKCQTTKTEEIEATGHTAVTDPAVAATCTETGLTEGSHCSVCGEVLVAQETVNALGHAWNPNNCAEAGTCTREGCGATRAAGEHVWGDWTVTTAPTCTEKGIETCYCNHCPETETRDVDALGHGYKDGVCTVCGAKDPDYTPPVVKDNPFVDVSESSVYYDAILWAYYHEPQQITGGYTATEFCPGNPCTRGQVVTFLWRAAGCPEPTGDTSMFNDASSIASPYRKAVAWAVENGITTGYNDGTFRPNDSVTRAQFVTFLWRYENKPATSGSIAGFTDAASISGPYQQAVAWAVEKGITTGYNDGTFRPNATCTRWAVVLFMYRDMA